MRPRVKPALRHILRDDQTLQYGAHPLRAVVLSGLTRPVRQWIEGLDGTRDLERVLSTASAAGLDEADARSLLDHLTTQGALHDASAGPASLCGLTLAERDRLRPDLDALDLSSTAPEGGIGLLAKRRAARVRVYGAGRVGAQIVALLAAAGVGHIRVIDPEVARASDITPGGLTWSEVGMAREEGAAAAARRLLFGDRPTGDADAQRNDQRGDAPAGSAADRGRRHPGVAQPATRQDDAKTRPGSNRPQSPGKGPHPGRGPDASKGPCSGRGPRPGSGPHPTDGTNPGRRPHPADETNRGGGRDIGAGTDPGRGPHPGDGTAPGKGRDLGVGRTEPDVGRRKRRRVDGQDLVRPAVEVLAGGTYLGDRSDRPDLVIIAPVRPLDGVLVNELTCLDIPHLLAAGFEGHGMVGPLVLPGETACLHCLDLTRRDHDPGWPIVSARLGGYPPGEIACDTTLATLVAAEAVGHALAHLDGRESAVTNSTMEITPDWRWKNRSCRIHPQCRCVRNNPLSLRMVVSRSRD